MLGRVLGPPDRLGGPWSPQMIMFQYSLLSFIMLEGKSGLKPSKTKAEKLNIYESEYSCMPHLTVQSIVR